MPYDAVSVSSCSYGSNSSQNVMQWNSVNGSALEGSTCNVPYSLSLYLSP